MEFLNLELRPRRAQQHGESGAKGNVHSCQQWIIAWLLKARWHQPYPNRYGCRAAGGQSVCTLMTTARTLKSSWCPDAPMRICDTVLGKENPKTGGETLRGRGFVLKWVYTGRSWFAHLADVICAAPSSASGALRSEPSAQLCGASGLGSGSACLCCGWETVPTQAENSVERGLPLVSLLTRTAVLHCPLYNAWK